VDESEHLHQSLRLFSAHLTKRRVCSNMNVQQPRMYLPDESMAQNWW